MDLLDDFKALENLFKLNGGFFGDKNILFIRYNNYVEIILAGIKQKALTPKIFLIVRDLFEIIK